jgi:hypothetical protein
MVLGIVIEKKRLILAHYRVLIGITIGLLLVWYLIPVLMSSQDPRAQGVAGHGRLRFLLTLLEAMLLTIEFNVRVADSASGK